jgi:hypothetical protein
MSCSFHLWSISLRFSSSAFLSHFIRFLEAINGLMVLNDKMRSDGGEELIAKRVCVRRILAAQWYEHTSDEL